MNLTTSGNAYKSAVVDTTERARAAYDEWAAASEAYERTHSLMDREALLVARAKWQEATQKHSRETTAFTDWYMKRKYNRGAS